MLAPLPKLGNGHAMFLHNGSITVCDGCGNQVKDLNPRVFLLYLPQASTAWVRLTIKLFSNAQPSSMNYLSFKNYQEIFSNEWN